MAAQPLPSAVTAGMVVGATSAPRAEVRVDREATETHWVGAAETARCLSQGKGTS